MSLPNLTTVRLRTDQYRSQGVAAGAIGAIVDLYADGYEVEFSRGDGTTIAWFAVARDDVDPYAPVAAEAPTRQLG